MASGGDEQGTPTGGEDEQGKEEEQGVRRICNGEWRRRSSRAGEGDGSEDRAVTRKEHRAGSGLAIGESPIRPFQPGQARGVRMADASRPRTIANEPNSQKMALGNQGLGWAAN